MSKTHWKALADSSEYLGKQHIDPDAGDLVVTIKKAGEQEVFNSKTKRKDVARVVEFVEDVRPMIFNATNCRTVEAIYGSGYVEDWAGKKIAIFIDPNVPNPSGGSPGGLRVRPFIPREDEAFCEDCGEPITRHGDYSVNKIVKLSRNKYGKALCWDCAQSRKEAGK